jgi:hypothetical protein
MQDLALWLVALLALGVDGLVWGITAHALVRRLGVPRERTHVPALAAAAVFVVWDRWLFAALVGWVAFAGRPSAVPGGLLGALEVVVQVGATWSGFRLGRWLLDGILLRARRDAAAPA